MTRQLPLDLHWPVHQRFDSFHESDGARVLPALAAAAALPGTDWHYLHGPAGSGKTHLLIATCAAATAAGRRAQYLDLAGLGAERPAQIRALAGTDLLALDGVHALAGDAGAEHALFDLYNRCRAEQATLVFAARKPAPALGLALRDLASRLASSAQWSLRPLDEAARREVLRERAAARGLVLEDAVLDWVFARQARDLGTLVALLQQIDNAALAAQRRITIPFLRELLGEQGGADA